MDLRRRRGRDPPRAALTGVGAVRVSGARAAVGLGSAAVGVGLLVVVLRQADPEAARALWAEARPVWFVPLFAAFGANHALRIVRWHVALAAPGVSLARNAGVCLVAFLAIALLPLRLGELVRPALLARDGVPVGRTLAAVVVERVLDLVAMLLLVGWAAAVPALPPIVLEGVDVLAVARRIALAGVLGLASGLVVAVIAGPRLARLPVVGPTAVAIADAVQELARSPARGAWLAVLTALAWASTLAYARAALGIVPSLPQGVEATAVTWATMMATILALPTPGFLGAFEAGAVAALALYGAPPSVAGVWGLGFHASYVGFVGVAGLAGAAALGGPAPSVAAR